MPVAKYLKRDDVLASSEVLSVDTQDYGRIDVVPVEYLTSIPTIDAQPMKYGRCIIDNEGYERCSVCNEHETGMQYFAFCPRCGARIG